MKFLSRSAEGSLLACTLALLAAQASAGTVIVGASDFGTLVQPYTNSFGASVAPLANAGDSFISEYGFNIGSSASFSGAVVTFDLGNILQLSNLSLKLLSGSVWSGAVPTTLTSTQLSAINASMVALGNGNSSTETISAITLAPGSYVIELQGLVTGSAGGSYAGVLNVAPVSPVPEPASSAYAIAGFGLLAAGFVGRRFKRR
jgi:hypothetical protein